MKKLYTLLFTSLFMFSASSQTSFCENFDSYNSNDPIAQSSLSWNTWGELMTGASPALDDAYVSSSQANSGSNSLYLNETSSPVPDIILIFDTLSSHSLGWRFNNGQVMSWDSVPGSLSASWGAAPSSPYTTGTFEYSNMMYIVPGKTGYFNFQAENVPSTLR